MKLNHLYVHIPFCKYICSYCDFCKKTQKYYDKQAYIDLLVAELLLYQKQYNLEINLDTLYIGGGTPSVFKRDDLLYFYKHFLSLLTFKKDYEFSFEVNPDDITPQYCELLQQIGVNRLSIGIQSVNNHILQILNRPYTLNTVKRALKIASKYFDNISIDLMFNLPLQKQQDIDDSIALIKQFSCIKHISYYSLILEPHTKLALCNYQYLDEDQEANLYQNIQQQLQACGFYQYEISNWAKDKNYISKHNFAYWDDKYYLGLGLSASSYYDNYRFTNTCSYHNYQTNIKKQILKPYEITKLTPEDKLNDKIMLALRTKKGIPLTLVKNLESITPFFDIINNNIVIKDKYFFISNELIIKILLQLED